MVEGGTQQGAALNQTLGQAGIFAAEIIPRSLSLEEFFLSVTGQPPMPTGPYPPQQPSGYPPQVAPPAMQVPPYPNQPGSFNGEDRGA